jgi:hypothetical protein
VLGAGTVQVAKEPQQPAEFIVPGADPAVVWTIGGCVDGQGPFELLAGGLVVPSLAQCSPELVMPVTHRRVVESKGLLAEDQGPLGQRSSLPRLPSGPQVGGRPLESDAGSSRHIQRTNVAIAGWTGGSTLAAIADDIVRALRSTLVQALLHPAPKSA